MACPHPIDPANRQKNIEHNSARFLEIEPQLYELRAFTILALYAFDFLFDPDTAVFDGGSLTFTVQGDQFRALQFALDEAKDRAAKLCAAA